jgi:putative membrane protein
MKLERFIKQFNWRFILVRIIVNAIALFITAAVLPKIYFVDKTVLNLLFMAIMLGVLTVIIKPILQFLTIQFIFVTYGLVLVLVNALLLWLLSFLFPDRFAVDSIFWVLVGGLVLGLVSSFFESLLGLTMPIVPDEPPELRRQVEEQAHQVDWLAAKSIEEITEEPALTIESPTPDEAADSAEAGSAERGSAEAESPDSEPAETQPPSTDQDEGSSSSVEGEAEVSDPMDEGESNPASESQEEQMEDLS